MTTTTSLNTMKGRAHVSCMTFCWENGIIPCVVALPLRSSLSHGGSRMSVITSTMAGDAITSLTEEREMAPEPKSRTLLPSLREGVGQMPLQLASLPAGNFAKDSSEDHFDLSDYLV